MEKEVNKEIHNHYHINIWPSGELGAAIGAAFIILAFTMPIVLMVIFAK